ncbi:unnamed protein product [Macrosiphum euphorbiae]|uniref:HAT C-terminal dimerisation domain-containing protein n=1 Tax=Macrosiphum euphorbiae TaxID=13131 RepID=A0AAV0XQX5_9HEMI|nr:unnamed protein product [Macrosiphum euphorbiae]
MKRTQQSLLHFYKKSKQSTECVDDTVPSTSNVLQDDDIMATLETEKTAPSPPVISPVIEPSLKCLDSKFDIGGYVEYKNNLSDEEKVSILQNVWTPDLKFNFPYDNSGKYKRKFQIKWLETFKWLAYSKLREGLFCKFCVLFLNLNQVGKGSHEKLGKLVLKPLTKLKDALEDFRNHEKNDYHKNSLLTADNIKAILEKKQDNILVQLNSKRKDEVIKNRAKLKPIIQTIRLCGRQQIALRGHEDSGRISLEEPKNNDGNFRCLLRYRSKNGDNVLKEHLETSGYETTDIPQIEQFSLCIRYVDEQVFSIREDFLTFVPVYDISGEEPVVAALEEVQSECSGTDSSKRANSLLHFSDVISVFQSIRENVDLKFNNIYKEAKDVAEKLNIEPKMPRICSSQRNRSNVPSNNIEEYYKKSIFIPYLDDLLMALNERFIPHNETITSLQYVLPSIVVEKPFSYLKIAVEFYENDLPGLNDVIEAEYEIWQAKWKNIEDNLRPTTAIEALSVCDNLMYPNMYELLKILAIIPVSTATAERSFSTLRRLKTYLRNTTSESRLVGLALLAIHRDIDIPDDILLDKFANSGKERNLNLI